MKKFMFYKQLSTKTVSMVQKQETKKKNVEETHEQKTVTKVNANRNKYPEKEKHLNTV